jgi:hypothetical protein
MSHSIEVCIKFDGTLEQLKGGVESVLGITLSHSETGSATLRTYYGKLLTIDVALSVNYLDTDRELNFADFQYVLSTRVAGHACAQRLLELQLPLTDTIGVLLSNHLGVEAMVTIEVQDLHARYHPDR